MLEWKNTSTLALLKNNSLFLGRKTWCLETSCSHLHINFRCRMEVRKIRTVWHTTVCMYSPLCSGTWVNEGVVTGEIAMKVIMVLPQYLINNMKSMKHCAGVKAKRVILAKLCQDLQVCYNYHGALKQSQPQNEESGWFPQSVGAAAFIKWWLCATGEKPR